MLFLARFRAHLESTVVPLGRGRLPSKGRHPQVRFQLVLEAQRGQYRPLPMHPEGCLVRWFQTVHESLSTGVEARCQRRGIPT